MNILSAMRRRHKRWIPRLAGPFAIVWLSMLWQPCAMAADMDMDMGHEQHSCPHCPPPMHEDCKGNAIGECDYLDRFDTDRRASKLKFEESKADAQPVLLSACQSLQLATVLASHPSFSKHATAPPGPPLNVLFCTYLN